MKHPVPPGALVAWCTRSMGRRMGLAFGAMCLLLVVLAVASSVSTRALFDQQSSLLDKHLPRMADLQGVSRDMVAINLTARDLVIRGSGAVELLQQLDTGRTRVGEGLQKLQVHLEQSGEADNTHAERLNHYASGMLVSLVKFGRLSKAGRQDDARNLLATDLQPKLDALLGIVDQLQAQEMEQVGAVRTQSASALLRAHTTTAIVLGAALLLAVALAWSLSRSVSQSVKSTVREVERIATGDLSNPIAARGHDEIADLQRALHRMQSELGGLVTGMRATADEVAEAARDIAESSTDLSRRTDASVSSLQQTAASVESFAERVVDTVQHAQSADRLAADATRAAQRGSSVMAEVLASMEGIKAASHKIEEITGVIDGIAFQTNILALNAAVEAARAGEQGKGFAVVASEVRSLAGRAAAAAREIKSLIAESSTRVGSGSELVRHAATAMREIEGRSSDVSGLIAQISQAAVQQNGSLTQVRGSLAELDSITRENASLVEAGSASAGGLQAQASGLQQMVMRFRLARVA